MIWYKQLHVSLRDMYLFSTEQPLGIQGNYWYYGTDNHICFVNKNTLNELSQFNFHHRIKPYVSIICIVLVRSEVLK